MATRGADRRSMEDMLCVFSRGRSKHTVVLPTDKFVSVQISFLVVVREYELKDYTSVTTSKWCESHVMMFTKLCGKSLAHIEGPTAIV